MQSSASPDAMSNDHGTETFTDTPFEIEMELDDFYFDPDNDQGAGWLICDDQAHQRR